jgi:hypothetical protein
MEAVSSSEKSVNIYRTTPCNIQGDSHLHSRRRGNLKSHGNKIAMDVIMILMHWT